MCFVYSCGLCVLIGLTYLRVVAVILRVRMFGVECLSNCVRWAGLSFYVVGRIYCFGVFDLC